MYNGVNTTFECIHKGATSIQSPFDRHEMDISTIDKFPYGKDHPIEMGRLHHGCAFDIAFHLMNLVTTFFISFVSVRPNWISFVEWAGISQKWIQLLPTRKLICETIFEHKENYHISKSKLDDFLMFFNQINLNVLR